MEAEVGHSGPAPTHRDPAPLLVSGSTLRGAAEVTALPSPAFQDRGRCTPPPGESQWRIAAAEVQPASLTRCEEDEAQRRQTQQTYDRIATASSSSASSDTQAEAATPSRRVSASQRVVSPVSPATPAATHAPLCAEDGVGSATVATRTSPSPPLSLTHPIVQFLAGVQLQGYAATLLHDHGIRTMHDLAARGSSADDVAALLGPLASLQQQSELWRGLRRWEREEARRAKTEAADARRRALEAERCARRAVKEHARPPRRGRRTSGTAVMEEAVVNATSVCLASGSGGGGRPATTFFDALGDCLGDDASACFRLSAVGGPAPEAPPLCRDEDVHRFTVVSSSGGGDGAAPVSEEHLRSQPPASSWSLSGSLSHPSLTASATQLMRQLSYRCRHSRHATAARLRGHRGARSLSDVAVPCDASVSGQPCSRLTAADAPYDVDAEDDSDASDLCATEMQRRAQHSGCEALRLGRAESDGRSDSESQPSCAQRVRAASVASGDRSEGDAELSPPLPPSTDSGLSSVLHSLREAVEREAPLSSVRCPTPSDEDGAAEGSTASAALRRHIETASHISLGALSTCAELRRLPRVAQSSSAAAAEGTGTGEACLTSEVPPLPPSTLRCASVPTSPSCELDDCAVAAPSDVHLTDRVAEARRRLGDALRAALQSYNAEVAAIRDAADAAVARACLPLCAVLRRADGGGGMDAPATLVQWAMGTEDRCGCGEGRVSPHAHPTPLCPAGSPSTTTTAATSAAAEEDKHMNADVARVSATASADVSARTTARSTAVPAPQSSGATRAPSSNATTTATTTSSMVSTGDEYGGVTSRVSAVAAVALCEGEGADDNCSDVSCASVGELTVGCQRLSARIDASRGTITTITTTTSVVTVAAIGADAHPSHSGAALRCIAGETPPATVCDAAAAHAAVAVVVPTAAVDPGDASRSASSGGEGWWAAYGIDALEYTQNVMDNNNNSDDDGGGDEKPLSPGGVATRDRSDAVVACIRTPSPAPREVIELCSSSATDDVDAGRRLSAVSAPSLLRAPPPSPPLAVRGDGVVEPLANAASYPRASSPESYSTRLHPESWPRMSTEELRCLCAELGLLVPPPPPLLPPPSASPRAVSRRSGSSPRWDAFGLPQPPTPITCRELFDAETSTASPLPLPLHAPEAVPPAGAAAPQEGSCRRSLATPAAAVGEGTGVRLRRAALVEREALLDALRLLAVRLRFRHAVAPFFLHRVSRLSGLPYKRVRAADLLDEGSVLTRDDLQQARLRHKAEERAEVDRCVVAALAAEAAEAVEQSSDRVAACVALRHGKEESGAAAAVAAAAAPAAPSNCYDQILLREPVDVAAVVAAVQHSFAHISHSRVLGLLLANDVMAEVVPARAPESPSPSQSSPPPPTAASGAVEAAATPAAPPPYATPSTDAPATPLSQEQRQRAKARHFFASRGHMTQWRGSRRGRR
ncbi:hypothetical protein NESM_000495900 [Novymonas esmeraldas]|uniref:SAM domain-containing protein n=1 Tax=Novymonas esmeraldas TaxID=1808958 RepID=A0AAW0EPU1_9TRYP